MAVLLLLTVLAFAFSLCLRINKSVSYEDSGKMEVVCHDVAFTLGFVRISVAEHIHRRRHPGKLGQRGATPEPGLRAGEEDT